MRGAQAFAFTAGLSCLSCDESQAPPFCVELSSRLWLPTQKLQKAAVGWESKGSSGLEWGQWRGPVGRTCGTPLCYTSCSFHEAKVHQTYTNGQTKGQRVRKTLLHLCHLRAWQHGHRTGA